MKTEESKQVAVGYCRVSTPGQRENGISLQGQRKRIQAWARENGYELLEVFSDEGISGGKMGNRPGLQQALDLVCEEKGVLIFYSLSRLCRSVVDCYRIGARVEKCGGNLKSLTEAIETVTPQGRLFFGVLTILAQFEADLTGQRTAAALADLRARGKKTGGYRPFGHRVDRKGFLHEDPEEQATLRAARRLREQGKTYQTIANHLMSRGVKTVKGSAQWRPQNVWNLLRQHA